jgi:hypothetical protein
MVFTTQCPKCGKILWFSNKLAGTLSICPACGGTLRLEPPPMPVENAPATPPADLSAADTAHGMTVEGVGQSGQDSVPPASENNSPNPDASQFQSAAQGLVPQSPVSALDKIYVDPPDQEADDRIPPIVAQSFLTHQAAAAVGESHVNVDQSDLAQWPAQQAPPAPPTAPPVWEPAPLSGLTARPGHAPSDAPWFPPPASGSRSWSSLVTRPSGKRWSGVEPTQILPWAIGGTAALIVIVGLAWLLPRNPSAGPWEEAHRKEILDIKHAAEQLSTEGKYGDAIKKYQDLENLVNGQQIEDIHLKEELEKSWNMLDVLRNRAFNEAHPAQAGGQTRPAEEPQHPPQAVVTPEIPAPLVSVPQSAAPQPSAPAPTALPPAVLPPTSAPSSPVISAQSRPQTIARAPGTTRPAVASAAAPSTVPTAAAQSSAPSLMPRPAIRPSARKEAGLTDAQIGAAITHGADFLLEQFDGPQLSAHDQYHEGLDCLAVYALMQAGLATHDKRLDIHTPFMVDAIEYMKKLEMHHMYITYARALRATALALYDRPEDHWVIKQDVDWLLKAQFGGAYTYTDVFARQSDFSFWDNSNSQYGLLGVWSGAEVGAVVPASYWRDVQTHWTRDQMPDGQWRYRAFDSTPRKSMTLAGIASLFVTADYLDSEESGDKVGHPPFSPALAKGLAWLENGDNSQVALSDQYDFYTLYGLERAGLASGFKFFGEHDWYREHAAALVTSGRPEGSWGSSEAVDSIVDTSYSLLFLARGRHPIIMNKLRFDGDWANRPRDASNLARFASADLERPLNWQVVPLNHDWHDWTDSPILYLASDKPLVISDADREKIRSYILNGGMLLSQADGDSPEFTAYIEDLGKRMFPQYAWVDLPLDHPLLSTSYKISDPPKTRIITNGSRILMMHWPKDVTSHWQARHEQQNQPALQMGVDLLLYAVGKSELKNRLQTDYVPQSATAPLASIRVARVNYDGNWDPEPAAWPRANRWFRQATGLEMTLEPTAMEDLPTANPPIAHLTGTARFDATDARVAAIRKYVQAGGVLLIDPCGMPGDFYRCVREELLPKAFPQAQLQTIDNSSPLLSAKTDGMTDVSAPAVREFVRTLPDGTSHIRPLIFKSGKGHVVLLPLDLTSGLLGTTAWGIAGYQPEYSLALLKNLVLWAWDGQKDN